MSGKLVVLGGLMIACIGIGHSLGDAQVHTKTVTHIKTVRVPVTVTETHTVTKWVAKVLPADCLELIALTDDVVAYSNGVAADASHMQLDLEAFDSASSGLGFTIDQVNKAFEQVQLDLGQLEQYSVHSLADKDQIADLVVLCNKEIKES